MPSSEASVSNTTLHNSIVGLPVCLEPRANPNLPPVAETASGAAARATGRMVEKRMLKSSKYG